MHSRLRTFVAERRGEAAAALPGFAAAGERGRRALENENGQGKTRTSPNTEPFGVTRIKLELMNNPAAMEKACREYAELVKTVSGALRKGLGNGPYDEEQFLKGIWGVMSGILKFGKPRKGFLHDALNRGALDCDTRATLVFDVGTELGIGVSLAIMPGHVFIATESRYFETTSGAIWDADNLPANYKNFLKLNSPENLDGLLHTFSVEALGCEQRYGVAIIEARKALAINPADCHTETELGTLCVKVGNYQEGIRLLEEVNRIDTSDYSSLIVLAHAYEKTGNRGMAIRTYTRALERRAEWLLASRNGIEEGLYPAGKFRKAIEGDMCFLRRGTCYLQSRKFSRALADFRSFFLVATENPLPYLKILVLSRMQAEIARASAQ